MTQAAFDPSYTQNGQGQFNYNGTSEVSGAATDYFPTEAAAQGAWFASNPGYSADAAAPNAAGSNQTPGMAGTPAPNPGTTLQPQYMSQLFPNGIPQAATNQAGTPQQVGAPSQINQILQASQNLPQVGTSSIMGQIGSQLGPEALQQQVTAAMQPQFTANQHALDETLANAGISGGSALGGQVDLANTENTQLAGALAPYEAQSQQNVLAGTTTDAANQLSASGQNTGNAMTTGNNQVNNIMQASLANQSANLSNNQFNTTAGNQMGQFNTSNLLNSGQFDANAFNTANSQAANINNQDWLQQLIGQQQLASGGQAGTTNAYTSTFSQPSGGSLAGFAPNMAFPTTPAAAPAPAPTGGGSNSTPYQVV